MIQAGCKRAAVPVRGTVVAGLVALLLAGCSLIEFAWDRADGAIVSRVDHWLALEPAQAEGLRERVDTWLADLRTTRVPRLAGALDELAARADDGFTAADARWAEARIEALYRPTAGEVIDWLVPTLLALDREQRLHLAERIRERNAEYWETYVAGDEEDRKRALAERIMRRVERWTGPLDVRQRELVFDAARELPDTAGDWYRFRARMQVGLLRRLEENAGAEAVAAHLRNWWIELEPRPPAHRAATRALRAGIRDLLVRLAGELTPAQRTSAVRRLRRAAASLDSLAASADGA